MIKNNYTCGIDIGTNYTKVVVVGYDKTKKENVILSTGSFATKGMRQGIINNPDQVAESIKKAVAQAESHIDFKIRRAYISVGGVGLGSTIATGSVLVSRADQEITPNDITRVINVSENSINLTNRKIVHTIPLVFKLDGKEILSKPEGLKGSKLEVKTLFITTQKQLIEDIATACGLAKIDIEEIIASPIALANIILSNKQKVAGCVLVDIGSETTSYVVYENNLPILTGVFPIGSSDITKDIALGLKVSLEEADTIKTGNIIGGDYSKKKVDDIIEARICDIFELVDNALKKIKRNELLPAGVVLVGGGSHVVDIEKIAKESLKLPSRVGCTDFNFINKFRVRDNSWYTALGLALSDSENNIQDQTIKNTSKEIKNFFKDILSQLLP